MATSDITSSGAVLTTNFYMKNFYRMNRDAIKVSTRNNYSQTELSYEDTRALKRAVAKLSSFEYEEGENGTNIASTIQAFAKTYNYTLESTTNEDSNLFRQQRQLKELTKKYEKELKEIGISIEEDGKLTIKDDILSNSSFEEIRKVFSDECDYVKGVRNIAKRLHNTSYDDIYTQITGNGGRLSILL